MVERYIKARTRFERNFFETVYPQNKNKNKNKMKKVDSDIICSKYTK